MRAKNRVFFERGVPLQMTCKDNQAAEMLALLIIKQISYYLARSSFDILGLSNILIKHGVLALKGVRFPSLILILSTALSNFLLIPRMDYLREIALQDGMTVMLSSLTNYYSILNWLTFSSLFAQIILGMIIAWRMTNTQSA